MEGFISASVAELEHKIESLKRYMIDTGMKLGLSNDKTIAISQELDTLIFRYQHLKH